MQKVFISEFADGITVETLFLVASKSIRETKNGDPYLCITCQDKSGTIECRAWDNALALDKRFEVDDFIALRGRVSSYRNELQLTVVDLERVDESNVALKDYLPYSRFEAEDLFEALMTLIESKISSPEIRRFLQALFSDTEFARAFQKAPAAATNHHAFLAGLLEHSLSMARLAIQLGRHYESYYPGLLNTDLVVTGAILHDMGKVDELTYRRSFDYSTEGRLVGHIQMGAEKVSQIARSMSPPLDPNLELQLKHLVLSHHGKQEYGAPVTPKTPEALLLHEIDMIDSRMNMLWNAINPAHETDQPAEGWTDYQRLFGGSLYIGGEAMQGWAADAPPASMGESLLKGLDGPASPAASSPAKSASPKSPTKSNLSLFDD